MTALIHHCKSSEHFSPVADVLLEIAAEGVRGAEEEDGKDRLGRILDIVTIAASVRQGSRLPRKYSNQS